MTTLIFDLETQRLADEVGGWDNIAKMKMACAVTLDLSTGGFKHYLEKDVEQLLADLRGASLVVGFNIRRFDYEVLRPYTGETPLELPTLDLLDDIHRVLGFRLSLDAVAGATLSHRKSADGLQAVQWYREGELQKLLAYCQQDVEITQKLYQYGRQNKHVKYLDRRGRLKLLPVKW
jgi:DEAD/DEAH box helicase domain-containing protein